MNIFMLAFMQMKREGRTIKDKNYYMMWERRVFQISKYLENSSRKLKKQGVVMYRISIITKNGITKSYNAETLEQLENYLLATDETEEVKLYRIMNKETKEVIETETGKR